MVVKLKIKPDELDKIIDSLKQHREPMLNSKIHEKVLFYLFTGVFKKLLKKQVDKSDRTHNREFVMTFTYPEAAALFDQLGRVKTDIFLNEVACLSIRNKLHKQLV